MQSAVEMKWKKTAIPGQGFCSKPHFIASSENWVDMQNR